MNYLNHNGTFGRRESPGTWTEEMDARMRILISEKRSASETASAINREFKTFFSRNAAIGRASRKGLGQFHSARLTPRAEKNKRIRYAVRRPPRIHDRIEEIQIVSREIDDQQIPIEHRCTLMQLNDHTCRWPVGDVMDKDFFFCGGKVLEGAPYCAGHCRRAFNFEARTKRFKPVLAKKAA